MKSTKNLVSTGLVVATVLAVAFTSVYTVAQDQKVPTKKELVTLLKTAKEPAEHRRIAAYYLQEAKRLRQDAKHHEELAQLYTEYPPYPGLVSKHGTDFGQGAPHCKHWAELDNQQANEAEALAALHEGMAKEAEKKQ